MLSGFSIFLDVDDLTDIALLEEYIASSDVLLVFLTRDYISSKNCRRELVAAMHQDLPIVVLRESEYGKGAVTSGGLQLEFEQLLPTLSIDEVNSNPNPNPNPNPNISLNPDPDPDPTLALLRSTRSVGCGSSSRQRPAAAPLGATAGPPRLVSSTGTERLGLGLRLG